MKKLLIALVAVISVVVFTGCGEQGNTGATSVDTKKPIVEIKAEAAKMDSAALQKQADAYQTEITKKTSELNAKTKELKDVPLTEVLGDKAKNLKTDIGTITNEINTLKERMQVYLDAAKKDTAQ